MAGKPPSLFQLLRRMPEFLNRPFLTVTLLVAPAIFLGVLPVFRAYGTRIAVEALTAGRATEFKRGAIVLIAAALTGRLLNLVHAKKRNDTAQDFAARQREMVVKSTLQIPLERYESLDRGDLVSRVTNDIGQASCLFTYLFRLMRLAVESVTSCVYMLVLEWRLGLAVAAVAIVIPILTGICSRSGGEKSAAFHKSVGDASTVALNTLEGVQVIKAYCAEEQAAGWFDMAAAKVFSAAMVYGTWVAKVQAWANGAVLYPYVVAFAYGGYLAYRGEVSLGSIMALVSLYGSLSGPVADMSKQWAYAARSLGAFNRVLEMVDMPAEADPKSSPGVGIPVEPAPASSPCISVNALSFSYGDGPPVLKDVSFSVDEGQLVVIVGKSGCGKSTLLKLLAGLYRPKPGTVFVKGFDAHYSSLSRVRPLVTYIPQEPYLFDGTIRDNLSLVLEGCAGEGYEGALRLVDALDFVREMPGGLDSHIGERGANLSGGERQRLCIARALLRDAPILLMDEPASSVDRESEARIWGVLNRLFVEKTCLVVTHRLDIARRAHAILVMDGGRIVERGTHEELMNKRRLYWALVTAEGGAVA